ncbi:formylglycine-generating enzyme family protein [Endothiovibrio diazotrophicus]
MLTVVPRRVALDALGSETLLKRTEDATLLEGDGAIRFRHQLLQEYFTAAAMRARIEASPPLSAAELWPTERWWARSGWEEAAVLLAGFHSDDCTRVIRWLRDAQPEVAVQCLLESGAAIRDRDALLAELHAAWRPRLTDPTRDPEPEGRAAVGRALGRLGLDDRKGVGLDADGLPGIDWVSIPGGEFVYQEGERRSLEPFQIARYPVTHAQFQAFLDAEDGYGDDRWWTGLESPDRNPERASWEIANHPRERVSWFEAMAFCGWLGHRLGVELRLPTEWEWERTARGTDGRAYPWGNDYQAGRANIDETWDEAGPHNLARTSAVGIYPGGASPEGVLDLAGNVWEWCLNEYADPERVGRGGSESRVLRGGSWFDYRDDARAGYRYDLPFDRSYFVGFRVVCASPIR